MKKLAALTLALLLTMSLTAACAQTYTAGNWFSVDYADSLTLDDTSYTGDNTDDYRWLFTLSDDTYLIDASLNTAEGYEGVSLYSATADDRDAYVQDTLDAFADDQAELVQTVELDNGIPFYIFSMEDSDGPYYYAETIANGNSLNFCCYYADANTALDDALLGKLVTLLKTFKPVTSA